MLIRIVLEDEYKFVCICSVCEHLRGQYLQKKFDQAYIKL